MKRYILQSLGSLECGHTRTSLFNGPFTGQISADGNLEHSEFLAEDEKDPRHAFLCSLSDALPKRGPIVAYNAGFESQRLSELANWMPEYAGKIAKIQARLWDLWPFVKKHVYHPQFHGSFSLKAILPALVPGFSYEGMEVSHGGEAGWPGTR